MKVLLRQDYESLGDAGKVVNVKDGYARNYLIPQGIAFEATPQNMSIHNQQMKREEAVKAKQRKAAEILSDQLNQVSITAPMPVGEDDRIFGSVTNQDIAELLAAKGYDIDRRKIVLDEPIRALGIYDVPIKLHSEVEGKVKLWVVKQ